MDVGSLQKLQPVRLGGCLCRLVIFGALLGPRLQGVLFLKGLQRH